MNVHKKLNSNPVRTRFAPSPTGFLHLGGARTALYNYAYAKAQNGQFILRVEDTDQERSVDGAIEDIVTGLQWLGIEIDESPFHPGPYKPYRQSEKRERYVELANQLVEEGKAYHCFCSKERLAQMRMAQQASRQPTVYDRRCRDLSPDQSNANLAMKMPYTIRMKMPTSSDTVYEDPLRGTTRFQNVLIDDQILVKTDGYPTYHLAHVIDDHDMKITHVIRGEEWIPSIAKHLRLFEIFGWPPPVYIHLPVILNPKGGKLSKRDGAVHLREYIKNGYLPEAMVNFLVLLGWGFASDSDLLTLSELCQNFDVFKVRHAAPKFFVDKLDHLNGVYLRKKSLDELQLLVLPYLQEDGLVSDPPTEDQLIRLKATLPLIQERIQRLDQATGLFSPFLVQTVTLADPNQIVPRKSDIKTTLNVLRRVKSKLESSESWEPEMIEQILRQTVEDLKVKIPQVFMAVRVAVTGSIKTPPLAESIAVIGKSWCMDRLHKAINDLESRQ